MLNHIGLHENNLHNTDDGGKPWVKSWGT